MFKTQNGWTKESMKEHVRNNFKDKSQNISGPGCLYRGPEGKKCAVGLFIPDEFYIPELDRAEGTLLEGTEVQHILRAYPHLEGFMPLEVKALTGFQTFHDNLSDSKTEIEQTESLLRWIETRVE